MLKAAKIALGSSIAIYAAHILHLDYEISAGTIALLIIVTTKWETLKLSLFRMITLLITIVLAWTVFFYVDNEWVAYGIFVFLLVIICEILGWGATLSVNAVNGAHFLTRLEFGRAFIINESLLVLIGITVAIVHDSKKEKLFSKVSDAVLARAFKEIGLKSTVLKKRSDSADVLAESYIHGYTLVADAKSFRMSRTAKNQKDFKVTALSGWRRDAEYAVLCAPYFQYPSKISQVYAQAIEQNVCLFSWEHLVFLIANNITETMDLNFSEVWNFSKLYSHQVLCADMKKCFIREFDKAMLHLTEKEERQFASLLEEQAAAMVRRGKLEKCYWEEEKKKIEQYTREQAISELIESKKIHKKIKQIDTYIRSLQK